MAHTPQSVRDASRDGGSPSRVVVSVQVPDGCVAPFKASVAFSPETAEEFEQVVEACGGPAAFTPVSNFVFAVVDGGMVHLQRPRAVAELRPIRDPFMDEFDKRIAAAKAAL